MHVLGGHVPCMAVSLEVREISEADAYALVGRDHFILPAENDRPFGGMPSAAVAVAVGSQVEALTGKRPRMAFRVLDGSIGILYVTEDDFPGSGIYRVTVTP